MASIIFTILKYTFYLCNLIILLMGVMLLLVGVYAKINTPTIPDPIISLLNPGNIIIAFSVLIIVFGLLGTLGSVRENTPLLTIYAGCIILLIILQIALILFVFLGKAKFEEISNDAILKLIENYRTFSDLRILVDIVQISLKCCGSLSIEDWDRNIYFNCNFTGISACGVPTSCCKIHLQINSQCGYLVRNITARLPNIHNKGCIQGLEELITDNQNLLIGCLCTLFVIEIIVICFSLWLAVQVKKRKNRVTFSDSNKLLDQSAGTYDINDDNWEVMSF